MNARKRYVKRETEFVVAVQLNLETDGFTFRKWGGLQRCKAGDWIVNKRGETHTVDRETFERTYRAVRPGQYVKATPVWAEIATTAGEVGTKEGRTHYEPGDYLVSNEEDGSDAYAVSREDFDRMYQAIE